MITQIKNFDTIVQFLEHLKSKSEVVGILEYGNRRYDNMTKGGDYDLTVVTNTPISENINGLHFHIGGIPVDCAIKSVDEFKSDKAQSEFDTVHLKCKILYDPLCIMENLINEIKIKWAVPKELSESEIAWIRFTFKHTIDKLKFRLNDDKMYSYGLMQMNIIWFLESYMRIKNIDSGNLREAWRYMKENDHDLFVMFESFFTSCDLSVMFEKLQKTAEYILKDFGGLWKDDEVLLNYNGDCASDFEKENVIKLIF